MLKSPYLHYAWPTRPHIHLRYRVTRRCKTHHRALADTPSLQKCTIRLGRSKNPILNSIAREVSLTMTQEFFPQNSFPFKNLPRELRLQILNHPSRRLRHLQPQICPSSCRERQTAAWSIGASRPANVLFQMRTHIRRLLLSNRLPFLLNLLPMQIPALGAVHSEQTDVC